MSFLRYAYYFCLATFAPNYLQRIHDREYERDRRVAETVNGSLWLLGIDPKPYLELRDSEVCTVCNRETWVWFAGDEQCPRCMRKWLNEGLRQSTPSSLR